MLAPEVIRIDELRDMDNAIALDTRRDELLNAIDTHGIPWLE